MKVKDRYIKTVKIHDFQSHEDSFMEFEKGLNIIVGPSDSGKSAVIRAIKWALFNEIGKGDYFVRYGSKDSFVEIEFYDGTKIRRGRKKKTNYLVYHKVIGSDDNGNPVVEIKEYEAFGNEYPIEVLEDMEMSFVNIDKNSNKMGINVSDQLEGPFLLNETGTVKAQAIGKLAGVNILDRAISDLNTEIRQKKNIKSKIEESIKQLEDEIVEYEYLEDMEKKLTSTKEILDGIAEKGKFRENLMSLKTKYETVVSEVKAHEKLFSKYENIDDISVKVNQANILNEKLKILKTYYKTLKENKVKKEIFENYLKSVKDLDKAESNLNQILSKLNFLNHIISLNEKYMSNKKLINYGYELIKKYENADKSQVYLNEAQVMRDKLNKIRELNLRYIQNKKSIEEMKIYIEKADNFIEENISKYEENIKVLGFCPYCNRIITEDEIKSIWEHKKGCS